MHGLLDTLAILRRLPAYIDYYRTFFYVAKKNFTPKTRADAFYNNFITNYGIPVRIHSDNGANFDGNIIREQYVALQR